MPTKALSVKPQLPIAVESFKSILRKQSALIHDIEARLKRGEKASTLPLLVGLETVGVNYATAGRLLKVASGQIVKFYEDLWTDLPDAFTQAHTAGVYEYIQQKFGYGRQMADMYAYVWETYYSGKFLKESDIPKYVDLTRVSVGKLNDAAKYVREKKMVDKRWKILVSDSFGRKETRWLMKSKAVKTSAGDPVRTSSKPTSTRLVEETGDLQMYVNGKPEQVGYLNLTSKNPLVKKEIARIVKDSGIRRVK